MRKPMWSNALGHSTTSAFFISGPGVGFVSGNGRIEATEIVVATKLAGRVQNIMVDEGDVVQAGQPLAQMRIDVLDAQRNEARAQSQQAVSTVASAKAQVAARESDTAAAQTTTKASQAEVIGAGFGVDATEATVARVEADIQDSRLVSPRDGRVQYRVAQPGEVLAAGGKVLNMVDLSDVYMTFFLPETVVGKVAMGSEVHIVLDAAPQS